MTTNKPEVKRYDCTSGGAKHCYGCYTMEETEMGDYVEWEAYETLQAECEKLRKLATECADYLDTNDMTSICHGSVLHRRLLDAALSQPKEQQPSAGDSLTSEPDEVFAAEFSAWWEGHGQFCRAGGGTYERSFAFEAWRHLYPQLMNLKMAAAEQQAATDVAALVEALEAALMVMTSKEVRLEKQADAITMVRSQLAAHQKRETSHDE